MNSNSKDKNDSLLNHVKTINKGNIELELLKKENQVLKEENLKLKTEITIKNEHITHNTSSNFFLISQIERIWTEIGENNINECFVDYYSYPDILHEIICKIVNMIQKIVSNTTSSIIGNFMNECNISTGNQSDYSFILKKIYVIIKEYHKDVFHKDNLFNSFKEEFLHYMKQEIFQKINKALQEQTENEINLKSFRSLYTNLLNVIIFIEFSDNLMLRINPQIKEVKTFTLPTSKCICVEGRFDKNKEYLILIPSPTTKKGFIKYSKLLPIVISYHHDIKTNSLRKYNQHIDLKLEIENTNQKPFDLKYTNNMNNNKENSQNETIQNSNKKHLLTMRYFNTNYNFKLCNNINRHFKKNETSNNNSNNIDNSNFNSNLNMGGTNKSPTTKSKRVSNIKKSIHMFNKKKYLSPQTEKRGNSLKNSKTNQIFTINNIPSIIGKQKNKRNNLHSQQSNPKNSSANTKNNTLSKSKHRSLLSLHYVRGEDDMPPKKDFIKIKEYIAHRITKHKQNNVGIQNKHKKSNTNSIGDNCILHGIGFYSNNNKYNMNSNNIFTINNIYENERNNTTENINHLKLYSANLGMSKKK